MKGAVISPYVLTNRTGMNLIITSGIISPAKLKSNEKMHLEMKSFDMSKETNKLITFEIEGDASEYEFNINVGIEEKLRIKYQNREYFLIIKSILSSMVKEIILSSQYVIENKTSFPLIFIPYNDVIKLDAF